MWKLSAQFAFEQLYVNANLPVIWRNEMTHVGKWFAQGLRTFTPGERSCL